MRTASLSVFVIVLALASIVAGYLGGQASSHPPAIVALRPTSLPSGTPVTAANLANAMRRVSDSEVVDPFSEDDVVVERDRRALRNWAKPRLSLVVGLTGNSVVVESQFLRLGVPMAFDVNPSASEAAAFAKLVRANGDALFIHVGSAPTAPILLRLREQFGAFDGIAARVTSGMPKALQGTGLTFFDEEGDAAPGPFAQARVTLVHRDVTIDDRTSQTYIAYMLDRAALQARGEGRLVVLMRPQPNTLQALNHFLSTASAEIAALR